MLLKVLKQFFNISGEIFRALGIAILNCIGANLKNLSMILRTALPYLMWYLGSYLYEQRGKFAVGSEIFIPIVVFLITYYLNQYANRIGKGERIPIPKKRFTHDGEMDGEIVIETDRTEEMILYMADLEDWLEKKGLMRHK